MRHSASNPAILMRLDFSGASGPVAATNLKDDSPMKITRIGSQPSGKGQETWFTGTVRVDPLFQTEDPARV